MAGQLGLEPLLDSRERASWATSPPVLTSVTVLEGKRTQVLVSPPGAVAAGGGAGKDHWLERQRTRR